MFNRATACLGRHGTLATTETESHLSQ